MKGIIIFEDANPTFKNVYCIDLNNSDVTMNICPEAVYTLTGIRDAMKTASCNINDTYDFETGALISLMKMCGVDKVVRACNEAFSEDTFKTYATKYERELHKCLEENKNFKEKSAELLGENSRLKYVKSCNESTIESLEKTRDLLKAENEKLKSDKDKSRKNYQRNIQKKQNRINELEAQVTASEDDKQKNIEYYEKEIKKLRGFLELYEKENKELKKNIDELFESEQHSKSELGRLYFEKHRLEEKVEKLKLDCEKLQHGYIDTDMIFCGGRQNGKQYTLLVDLFKKIDQKKVDAAYKEAYNTTLPVWQKEALRQAYEIRIESKEKAELPRTLDINGTTYRKSIQIKDFGEQINKLTVDSLIEQSRAFTRKCVDEWLYKIPTRREKKWERILEIRKENDVIIEVKKEDVTTFLHEIEDKIPEIRWCSRQKIFEAKGTIKDIYGALKSCDRIYFRLRKDNELSYSSDPDIYQYKDLEHISYLPPMRWDLFKKGRLAVKVTYDNYKEFYEACEKELGKRPSCMFTGDFTVSICKDDGFFEIFTVEDQKKTGRKIVDWEDVR